MVVEVETDSFNGVVFSSPTVEPAVLTGSLELINEPTGPNLVSACFKNGVAFSLAIF